MHTIGLFPELLGVGGVQEAGRLTAGALRDIGCSRGWKANFLSLNDPVGQQVIEAGRSEISFEGFQRRKIRFSLAGIGRARLMRAGAAGIVLAAHPNLALPASWIRRVRADVKILVMSHGIEVWKPLAILRRRALASADLVLAPSSDTAKKLIAVQGVTSGRVRVVPWAINPGLLRIADARVRALPPAGFPRGRVVLTVGRWASSERYKGADDLIRSVGHLCTQIPEIRLAVVGGGDDLPRLRRIAGDTGAADCVHFLENLSREEIAACYANAEIFALPSTGEGFGLVFLEAMAFSKPVVAAASGGTTDIVEDGVNGLLVSPGDAPALEQALRRLLRDDSLRERLGLCGAETVRRKYTFEVFRAALEEILGEVTPMPPEIRIASERL